MVKYAYGLYVIIEGDAKQIIKNTLKKPAKNKAEVAVRVDDDLREFTFEDFLSRLGFNHDGKEE